MAQLDEFSQAVNATTTKFDKLMRSTEEQLARSSENTDAAAAQEKLLQQIED